MKILMCACLMLSLSSCGPKAFIKGQYDDVQRENLLNDQWSESDMQLAVSSLVKSLEGTNYIKLHYGKPVAMITSLQNKTSEHIDTQSVMDMVRVELMKTGSIQFVDKEARGSIANELEYQTSGSVEAPVASGQQVGPAYIINGRLDSIVQDTVKEKTVYYKLTLNFTDIRTGGIIWSDHKQIRKTYSKRFVGN
ncbi:penicillin-binding protein activator LpoB [Bdellovibrio sp. HCB209]|uniref:penicillin-binding protein activator LpoB n=1 Tax=Bdellovibrio sp. HCB209 TaxID=3394354 RepID=UPI0039B4E55C